MTILNFFAFIYVALAYVFIVVKTKRKQSRLFDMTAQRSRRDEQRNGEFIDLQF